MGAAFSYMPALKVTESLRLQIINVLANPRTRRIVVGFLPRETAILVAKSWRLARNQQTTRLKCNMKIKDEAVIAIANMCGGLTTIDLSDCRNITDKAVIAIANNCGGLTTIDLYDCDLLRLTASTND